MNQGQKSQFKTLVKSRIVSLRNTIRSGTGRGTDGKEANCAELLDLLRELRCNTTDQDIAEAAAIVGTELGNRTVEWQRPPADGGAAQKLATLQRDSSGVSHILHGVTVQLDCDQLKHQHPTVPIGTREKGGGNRFVADCDADWHRDNTMEHMALWAVGLGQMAPGQQTFHGQATPVDGIHYEGFCLFANGQKYVSFHCYPSDGSDLKL